MTHWYRQDGTTAYGATLKEARENGYLPSVTTIDKVIANEGLEIWKIRQAVMSALTMPKKLAIPVIDHETNEFYIMPESDSDYINRILDDSRQQARKAAKLGSVIHKLAERLIKARPLFFHGQRQDVWTLFAPLNRWIIDQDLYCEPDGAEQVLVGDGYAGKADYNDKVIIIDFKSNFVKPEDIKKDGGIMKRKIYDSWGRQLVALQATSKTKRQCISVIISTNVDFPGVWCYYWTQEELDKHLQVFQAALKIYKIQKGL